MSAGRPTVLTEELVNKAREYLNTCVDNPILSDKGTLLYTEVKLPSVVGLARYLGVHSTTVYEMCKEDYDSTPELKQLFSSIVNEIKDAQHEKLLNNGLGGLYNPKTTGMILSKHGYAEKIETDQNIKGDLKINIVNYGDNTSS